MIAKGAGKPLLYMIIPSFMSYVLFIFIGCTILFLLGTLFLTLPLFTLFFFRDPERNIGDGIISPADGRVINVTESSFDVFMSATNVHVNRSPDSGRVAKMVHRSGTHRPAYSDDISGNERLTTTLETDEGSVRITQIAGIFARRIVPYVSEGDEIKKGDKIGMIRFGSRVRVELPPTAKITISNGVIVRAGETKVGEWS